MQPGESKEGDRGEDYETRLDVEDLQRGFVEEVQGGDEGEDKRRKK